MSDFIAGFAFLFMLFALAVAFMCGCADPIAAQARAATITAGVLTSGGSVVSEARDEALDRVEAAHPTDPEHDAEIELEAARWRPIGVALDSARAALGLWIDTIDLARIAGGGGDLLAPLVALAARVIEAYGRAVELAQALGIGGLPVLPTWVLTLATSLGGA